MYPEQGALSSKDSDTNAGFIEGKGSGKHLEMSIEPVDWSENDKDVKTSPASPSGSGSSKHSNSNLEVIDGSGSSKHSNSNLEVIDGSGSSKHSNSNLEAIDGSGSSNHSNSNLEAIDGSGSSKHSNSNPEIIDGSRSSTASEGQIDVSIRGERALESDCSEPHTIDTGSILDPARVSSASSSESSLDDVFKAETNKFESQELTPASKNEKNDVSSDSSAKSEVDNSSSILTSTSLPLTVSPPIQVMDPSEGYDPKRIPSSVFARSTSPMDWSAASNDSLFSIHLGNNSFSRDNAFILSEFYKSGELTKSGEFCMFSPHPFDIIPEDIEIDRKSADVEDLQENESSEDANKSEERLSEDQSKGKYSQPDTSCNLSNISGHSRWSNWSFAFPILTEMERNNSSKTNDPLRKSDEEASGPPQKGASGVAPRSTARCCSWFRCFSWSSCRTRGRCYRCRSCSCSRCCCCCC